MHAGHLPLFLLAAAVPRNQTMDRVIQTRAARARCADRCARLDPEAVDRQAREAQRELIEAHGGKEAMLRDRTGFSYSPPPGMNWRRMNRERG